MKIIILFIVVLFVACNSQSNQCDIECDNCNNIEQCRQCYDECLSSFK